MKDLQPWIIIIGSGIITLIIRYISYNYFLTYINNINSKLIYKVASFVFDFIYIVIYTILFFLLKYITDIYFKGII